MSNSRLKLNAELHKTSLSKGFGLFYAIRTARAWWYSAWLRTLARFSRTYIGSFWLGLSNLLSVAILGIVYGAVFKINDPWEYIVYLGLGYTIWGCISMTLISSCSLFTIRRERLLNDSMPAIFYCLEEWSFQMQTFSQSIILVLLACSFIKPILIYNSLLFIWLPLLNLSLFCLLVVMAVSLLGARYKDLAQLVPIIMQLTFLVSPILYRKEGLGRLGFIADLNPLYRILDSLRSAIVEGQLSFYGELLTLSVIIIFIYIIGISLKRQRYKIPFWV